MSDTLRPSTSTPTTRSATPMGRTGMPVDRLAYEIRRLLAERPALRTYGERQRWKADLADVRERFGYRDTGSTDGEVEKGPLQLQWSAVDAATHTATGPNQESLKVSPSADGNHRWSVEDRYGRRLGSGKARSRTSAKKAAEGHLKLLGKL
jgi:hypothetical protein